MRLGLKISTSFLRSYEPLMCWQIERFIGILEFKNLLLPKLPFSIHNLNQSTKLLKP